MITRELIKTIIGEAINAPSGDNSQPWRFEFRENGVDLYNIERDQTIFNFRRRGDYVAHGALLENIDIIAGHYGFMANSKLFPSGEVGAIAEILFAKDDAPDEELYQAIGKRVTNRKPYSGEMLAAEVKNALLEIGNANELVRLAIVERGEAFDGIVRAASLNDRLILENETIRKFLFSIIRWTEDEERATPGMHVKTLELGAPQQKMFRLFRKRSIARLASLIGFPSIMQKEATALYGTSGAMLVLSIKGEAPADFIAGGRIFERVWLKATAMGLSLQPLAAMPYLAQRIKAGDRDNVSEVQARDILKAEQDIRDAAHMETGTILMLARIGKGEAPTQKAFKLEPEIHEKMSV